MDLAPQHTLGGYREFAAPADLMSIVDAAWCYSRAENDAPIAGAGHRVLPETGVSLCFWSRRDANGVVSDPRLTVMGPAPSIRFFSPTPGLHLEALRLKPEWSRDLLGVDPVEHLDAMDALSAQSLLDRLARSRSSLEALSILVAEIRRRRDLSRIEPATHIAHRALERIRARQTSTIGVESLSREVRVSERQLRRAVVATTGLPPKHAHRIVRLNRAVAEADGSAAPDWAALAIDMGFYDQPHMIQEFHDLTGTSPAALHQERRAQQA
jgi:AraC-like DNA-binding protein